MSRLDDLHRVTSGGLVAIIRAPTDEALVGVAEALFEGGIDVIEVTMTVPRALETLAAVRDRLGKRILLGAGTVLDAATARSALLAGAEFIVAPHTDLETIELCHRYDRLVMPGALTPTEVVRAWQAGADIVKLFPADAGGPSYLRSLRAPLPQVRFLPTGGVNLDTLADYFRAGACAVGLGGALVERKAVAEGDFARIRDLAARYVEAVRQVRERAD